MSKETQEWLNQNCLVGFTEKRGNAWHYREGTNNHFPGAIPIDVVQQRLFAWTALEAPFYVPQPILTVSDDMVPSWSFHQSQVATDPTRKNIVRSDTGALLGSFKASYQPHQYNEWLLNNVKGILSQDLQIGSAVLLKGGAVACVSVETPDNIRTPEGVEFRPHFIAATSFDGTVATTYGDAFTNVVCDNTMHAALGEQGAHRMKVRHSAHSALKLGDAREALNMVFTMADDFRKEIAMLCDAKVSDNGFERILDAVAPIPELKENGNATRAGVLADAKRDKLWSMWTTDPRVTPWRYSAFGAWQALNTYQQHESLTRGKATRYERNMSATLSGKSECFDLDAVKLIMEHANA
jgi:phage/plasmid-like protein (TIGR03299 family)